MNKQSMTPEQRGEQFANAALRGIDATRAQVALAAGKAGYAVQYAKLFACAFVSTVRRGA